MPAEPDTHIARLAASVRRGSIIAAAGCGKTEQIARALSVSEDRRLILTHTHAGVDALTRRLKKLRIPRERYRIDTIAGWCLRFAASFPRRSGILATAPNSTAEWDAIYAAGTRLLDSGAVDGVIKSSYGGCFVDEYQDCTQQQHEVIRRLSNHLPTCVFGDPLQAIFDFRGQTPVSWEDDVFPIFGQAAELVTPWRWKNAGNENLAEWLRAVRVALLKGEVIDLSNRPNCIIWTALPADPRHQQAAIVRQCLESMRDVVLGNVIVIGDSTSENRRSALAQKLAQQGFVNIEAVGCKALFAAAKAIDGSVGQARFKMLLAFAAKCMTGADKAELERAADARQQGRRLGHAKFADLLQLSDAIVQDGGNPSMLAFLQALRDRPSVRIYRREMYFAMQSALQTTAKTQSTSLHASVWEVQNRSRHVGRRLGLRSIGSTLLVKGLEFDHSIAISTDTMSAKDWYVALTRATKTIKIISPSARLMPTK